MYCIWFPLSNLKNKLRLNFCTIKSKESRNTEDSDIDKGLITTFSTQLQ